MPQRAEVAVDLPTQPAGDGALTLTRGGLALVLASVRTSPGLAAQVAAFLGVGLLELDALCLGRLHQLCPCHIQHLGVGGIGDLTNEHKKTNGCCWLIKQLLSTSSE